MRLALSCDHYGYPLKFHLIKWLTAQGHQVVDAGGTLQPDEHFIDHADAVCTAVAKGDAERGIILCRSGGCMAIRANRYPQLRAVVGFEAAVLTHDREASDVNILALPAYYMAPEQAERLVTVFLATPFEALDRRVRRLQRLAAPPPMA